MIIENVITSVVRYNSTIKHLMTAGTSGSGKGFNMERLVSKYMMKGEKVIDFFSLERNEGFFYSVKNEVEFLIEKGKNLTMGVYEPRGFKNDILMFAGNKIIKERSMILPKNIRIVSLDEKDLENEDMLMLLGTSSTTISTLYMMFNVYKKFFNKPKVTLSDIRKACEWCLMKNCPNGEAKNILDTAHKQTIYVLQRNIEMTEESGLFNEAFERVDIHKLIKDNESITTISCSLLDDDIQRAIALSILMKKIFRFKQKNRKSKPTTIYIREMQTFFDKQKVIYQYSGMLREYINLILREGRDNKITLFADFQSLGDIPMNILGKFNKVFALRLPKNDAKKLSMFANIPDDIIDNMLNLKRGVGIYISNGNYAYPIYTIPPNFHKKSSGEDVFKALGNIYGLKEVTYEGNNKHKEKSVKEVAVSINTEMLDSSFV